MNMESGSKLVELGSVLNGAESGVKHQVFSGARHRAAAAESGAYIHAAAVAN